MRSTDNTRWPGEWIDARQAAAVQYRYQLASHAYWRHVYGDEQRHGRCDACTVLDGLCPEGARLNQVCRAIEEELEFLNQNR